MHVVIFEDDLWRRLAPLALSRPVFTLSTGMSSLLEKQIRHLAPSRLTLWVREELAEYCRESLVGKIGITTAVNEPLGDERVMLVSGRTLHFTRYKIPAGEGVVVDAGDRVRVAVGRAPGLTHLDALGQTDRWKQLLELPRLEPQTKLAGALWDLLAWNRESLKMDARELRGLANVESAGPYDLLAPKEIWRSEDVKIEPGAVLDAREGPIVLGDNVVIGANTVIQGPAFIGPYTYVRPVSLIRPGTTIGTMCKVGGEISNSIMLGWSNKSHDGYLGDSYVGKWVNLGALTTTSNLKNTYGEVSIDFGDEEILTGRTNLGALIGDHTKTAILTRFMTGSYVGFNCMIGCSSIPPRHIPSMSFMSDKGTRPYDIDKAMEVAKKMFARRERPWNQMEENVFKYAAAAAQEIEGAKAV
jgi:UDP-N-acetylglucosamine diphosphorylase / glucose-1-phosphate thymidylyltransferase / UDP-N-acetylgalactosamine diphosphorylase / glucosamine-1-phosphate N-acetyltransferase / galactosamine-1-phosphate N-acetyltransferase